MSAALRPCPWVPALGAPGAPLHAGQGGCLQVPADGGSLTEPRGAEAGGAPNHFVSSFHGRPERYHRGPGSPDPWRETGWRRHIPPGDTQPQNGATSWGWGGTPLGTALLRLRGRRVHREGGQLQPAHVNAGKRKKGTGGRMCLHVNACWWLPSSLLGARLRGRLPGQLVSCNWAGVCQRLPAAP